MRNLVIIVHNVRSCHNVGAILRIADGLALSEVIFTGYTPYPAAAAARETRLPHLAAKTNRQIHKTALGAEKTVKWSHRPDIITTITEHKNKGFSVIALEQTDYAIALLDYAPADKVALLVGNELTGMPPLITNSCDLSVEIPMLGKKESFNVATAAAMALYHLRHYTAR